MSTRQDKFEPKIIKLKKNVRALSPVLPVVRKLAGGSGEKMNLIIGLLNIKFQS